MSNLILTAELAYQHYLKTVHYNNDEYDEKRDKLVLRASMSNRCHRLQKYHMSPDHKPKELTADDMMVFRIGTVFHDEIQQGFNWLINERNKDNKSIELEMEKKVSINMHGLLVEGHFDIRLIDHTNKVVQLVDLKTMNPRSFSYFKKSPYDKKGNICQLGCYALATKEEFPDYEIILLLSGWEKDQGKFHEVEIDYNRAVIMANDYYKSLSASLELELDDIVPIQHPYSPVEQWECNYCNYNHICPSPKIKRV